jgi:hypothetical protein
MSLMPFYIHEYLSEMEIHTQKIIILDRGEFLLPLDFFNNEQITLERQKHRVTFSTAEWNGKKKCNNKSLSLSEHDFWKEEEKEKNFFISLGDGL